MLIKILLVVAGMMALAFAAVPLYRLFCQVTGYGGTTQVADALPDEMLERSINVKFNTDTGRNLLWSFRSEQRQMDLKVGQQGIMSFTAQNRDRVPVTAVAVYNVTPPKAGKYFHKLQCFCFGEQALNPGEEAQYPVVFYIDPKMDQDPNMSDVTTITLSYTFFKAESAELEKAMDDFTNSAARDPKNAGTVALPPEKQ